MVFVYDIETLVNCSVFVFKEVTTGQSKSFVIHELQDDTESFIKFLKKVVKEKHWLVGFNNINFDAQVLEKIIRCNSFPDNPEELSSFIYKAAQDTISATNNGGFPPYREKNLSTKNIDLFKILHYDNKNKRTSLKWVEFMMDFENVEEMPIHHTTFVNNIDEIQTIVEYCHNDVDATATLLSLCKPMIDLRFNLSKKYDLNFINYNNGKVGSELLLHLYAKATNQSPWDLRKLRTYRTIMPCKDIIFDYIEFKTLELQYFLDNLKKTSIDNTKEKSFSHEVVFKGYTFDFKKGGIHQCIKPGIYTSDINYIIMDLDVSSLYPSIACANTMYPHHLGENFYNIYKSEIVDVRLREKSKKEGKDMTIVEGYKEAANIPYGFC